MDRSYPKANSTAEVLIASLFIAAGIYVFLVVFQPFGTYNFSNPFKYLLLLPYALISFLVFTLADLYFRKKSNDWNVRKEIRKIVLVLSICAVFSYLYNIRFINHTSPALRSFLFMFLYTFALGVPVYLIYFLARYAFSGETLNLAIAQPELSAEVAAKKLLTIKPDTGNPFQLKQDDFLFAESESNYCTIFYLEHATLKKQLLRIPIKNLEEQVGNERIIRCHRSYIINTEKVSHVKGNAQGYKLSVEGWGPTIPVSRSYIHTIRDSFAIHNF